MHFRDKDELLVSGIHDMLRSVHKTESPPSGKRYERIIRFSLPIFEHIHRHSHMGAAKMGTRGRAVMHEHLQKVLAELISNDLKKDFQSRRRTVPAATGSSCPVHRLDVYARPELVGGEQKPASP